MPKTIIIQLGNGLMHGRLWKNVTLSGGLLKIINATRLTASDFEISPVTIKITPKTGKMIGIWFTTKCQYALLIFIYFKFLIIP